jgi:hypothetical protein
MPRNQISYFLKAIESGILSASCIPEVALFLMNKKKAVRFAGQNLKNFIIEGSDFFDWSWSSANMRKVQRSDTWYDLYPIKHDDDLMINEEEEQIEPIYVIGREQKYVNDLCFEEQQDPVVAGEMLGYPNCCIKKFAEFNLKREHWIHSIIDEHKKTIKANAQCNRLLAEFGGISPIGELYPCSLHCSFATQMANEARDSIVNLGLFELSHFLQKCSSSPMYICNSKSISLSSQSQSDTKILFSWKENNKSGDIDEYF